MMRDLAIEMETTAGAGANHDGSPRQALALAKWDTGFTQTLLRLLELLDNPVDTAMLGSGRLRELYYALLKGEAGAAARRAFGVGNEIARTIDYLSSHLSEQVTIDDMANHVGMSRAVFHRRFKEATTMTPIQFVKSMRLNSAAMKIAEGKTVSEAALGRGLSKLVAVQPGVQASLRPVSQAVEPCPATGTRFGLTAYPDINWRTDL